MKKYNLTSIIILFSIILSAQQLSWVKQLGGSNNLECYSISTDSYGSIYSTGEFSGSVDFDPGISTNSLTAYDEFDAYVSKVDSNGNYEWAFQIGGEEEQRSTSIFVDIADNIYIVGYFDGSVDFDPGSGQYLLTSSDYYDTFFAKYDINGNLIWAKQISGTYNQYGNSIVTDIDGDVYISGTFQGATDFDPGSNEFIITSYGNYDCFLLKVNNDGEFLWVKSFGGTDYETINAVVTDENRNIYLTGSFIGSVDFDPNSGVNVLSATTSDVFISMLDANGSYMWTKQFEGEGESYGTAINIDNTGNLYIGGFYNGNTDFNPGSSTHYLTSNGGRDVFVCKLDSDANLLWGKSFGGSQDDVTYALDIDVNNVVYICGYFEGTSDFDPGSSEHFLTSNGATDIFLSSIDTYGNFLSASHFGGYSIDFGRCININSFSNIYISGSFKETIEFIVGNTSFNLTSYGGADVFIAKLTPLPLNIFDIGQPQKHDYYAYFDISDGSVRLELGNNSKEIYIEIFDIRGVIVNSFNIYNTDSFRFFINEPPGLYFIKIVVDHEQQFAIIKILKD